eukprot:CAMPEP_0116866078 /NCGR_PEP_ID=MMETSP0418-20121206/25821_1 /TAXON_ID=1158023 /ORGANISM="Astrosyne radiata, Strain 13vi08-1A" /LENGTH=309 /DNA_ID=CAMNT_0004501657 /DNA_START=16 /DNA_END=945 /DNA_ORIENTATION=+
MTTPLNQSANLCGESSSSTSRSKKRSASVSLDAVALLNDVGISHLQSGKNSESLRYFSRALCRARGGTTSQSIPYARFSASSNLPVVMLDDHDHDGASILADNNNNNNIKDDGKAKPAKNDKVSNKALYVYQRDEYDEGMHAYSVPIRIDEMCEDQRLIASTLMYNIGQALVRCGEYEEAIGWFERALAKAYCTNADSRVNVTSIQNNLGHCCYRMGRYEDAMRCYHRALVGGCELGMSELDLASSLNCIAVLYFHNATAEVDKATRSKRFPRFGASGSWDPSTLDMATVLNNIGRIHYLRNEYNEASW